MLKLIIELFIIFAIVFGVLYMIEPKWAYGIINAALGTKQSNVTTTVTIPYTKLPHVYVNGTIKTLSYVFSNDTAFFMTGSNNRVTVTMEQLGISIPVLYVNTTGSQDILIIKNGVAVLNIWGSDDSVTLSNSTLLSANLHTNSNHVYNASSTNQTTFNGTK